ncbi:MAG: zinc ribbon domain-containing protein [Rhodothermales bacterium]
MPTVQEQPTESNITSQLRALVRLQHIDSRIHQLEKLRGDLPDEIRDLDDEKHGLETRIDKYRQEKVENEVAVRRAEMDIQDAEQLIKKYEEQQLQVRNNREYDALTKEIEAQRQRISDARTTIDQVESSKGEQELAIESAEARLEELKKVLEEKQKELNAVMKDTAAEQQDLEKIREKASEDVDDRYLRAYERLRERHRDNRAVVPLERGAAAGFAVPPQRQMEIRQRDRIIPCEHTGRIIVDSDLFFDTINDLER